MPNNHTRTRYTEVPAEDLLDAMCVEDHGYNSIIKAYPSRVQSTGKQWHIPVSVAVYWVFVSLIPIYNKYVVFRNTTFPFPIATAGIQLGAVTIILCSWNSIQRFTRDASQLSSPPTSWIGGPHLVWKLKHCAPIGVLFGLKYGVTNWGLHLVAAPTHLLLQATDLVWAVLWAWIINRERVNAVESACLIGCIAGSLILSWRQLHLHLQLNQPEASLTDANSTATVETATQSALFGIFINLLSPMLLGLCLATLRSACCELMRPDNRVHGTVSAVELTTIKLAISSFVAIIFATFFENHGEGGLSWWEAFLALSMISKLWVTVGGATLIAIFQVNCTWLTHLTSAISVGLVGQVKIIPQWLAAVAVAAWLSPPNEHVDMKQFNVVGALFIMGSAAVFAWSKFTTATSNTDETKDYLPVSSNTGEHQRLLAT